MATYDEPKDELTEAAHKDAFRFIERHFATFKRSIIADYPKDERDWLEQELGQRHVSVSSTPVGRAVATLTLPATCNIALSIWIATVETSYRKGAKGAIKYQRSLVKLDSHDNIFHQFLPALRDHYLQHRPTLDASRLDGAAYYMQAAVGDTNLATVKRLLERAKEIS